MELPSDTSVFNPSERHVPSMWTKIAAFGAVVAVAWYSVWAAEGARDHAVIGSSHLATAVKGPELPVEVPKERTVALSVSSIGLDDEPSDDLGDELEPGKDSLPYTGRTGERYSSIKLPTPPPEHSGFAMSPSRLERRGYLRPYYEQWDSEGQDGGATSAVNTWLSDALVAVDADSVARSMSCGPTLCRCRFIAASMDELRMIERLPYKSMHLIMGQPEMTGAGMELIVYSRLEELPI